MRIGIIGTGHMGGMLTRAWTQTGDPQPIHIYNRTLEKAVSLYKENPDKIIVHQDPETVIHESDSLFLCLKAKDTWDILPQIASSLSKDHRLFTTVSTITLAELEQALPCIVVKLIPSITQNVLAGSQLVMFGSRVSADDQRDMLTWLNRIGTPIPISEEQIRICSDLTSCGPAFLADWLLRFAKAAQKEGLSWNMAVFLVQSMVSGVGQLLKEGAWELTDIIDQVAVPGGVTAAGLAVLRASDDDVFASVFAATRARQEAITRTNRG